MSISNIRKGSTKLTEASLERHNRILELAAKISQIANKENSISVYSELARILRPGEKVTIGGKTLSKEACVQKVEEELIFSLMSVLRNHL